jgi:hypothetical protein
MEKRERQLRIVFIRVNQNNTRNPFIRATELNLLPSRHLLNGLESGDEVEEYNVNDLGTTV